jgi:hypothetical protein
VMLRGVCERLLQLERDQMERADEAGRNGWASSSMSVSVDGAASIDSPSAPKERWEHPHVAPAGGRMARVRLQTPGRTRCRPCCAGLPGGMLTRGAALRACRRSFDRDGEEAGFEDAEDALQRLVEREEAEQEVEEVRRGSL